MLFIGEKGKGVGDGAGKCAKSKWAKVLGILDCRTKLFVNREEMLGEKTPPREEWIREAALLGVVGTMRERQGEVFRDERAGRNGRL